MKASLIRSAFVMCLLCSVPFGGVGASTGGPQAGGVTVVSPPGPAYQPSPADLAMLAGVRANLQAKGCTDMDLRIVGEGAVANVPPDGFDPISASDTQLSCFGFPPRPSDAADLADWTNRMRKVHTYTVPSVATGSRVDSPRWPRLSVRRVTTRRPPFAVRPVLGCPALSSACGPKAVDHNTLPPARHLMAAWGPPRSATVLSGRLRVTLSLPHSHYPRYALTAARITVFNRGGSTARLPHWVYGTALRFPVAQARPLDRGGQPVRVPPFPWPGTQLHGGIRYVALGPHRSLRLANPVLVTTGRVGMTWEGVPFPTRHVPAVPVSVFNASRPRLTLSFSRRGRAVVSIRQQRPPRSSLFYSYRSDCAWLFGTVTLLTPDSPVESNWVRATKSRIKAGDLKKSCLYGHMKMIAGYEGYPSGVLNYKLKRR